MASEHEDPTGMRRLLSGMSDPTPMSEDLLSRIAASMENEDPQGRDGCPRSFDRAFDTPGRGRAGAFTAVGLALVGLAAAVVTVQALGIPLRAPVHGAQASLRQPAPAVAATPTAAVAAHPSSEARGAVDSAVGDTPARVVVLASGTRYRRGHLADQVEDVVGRSDSLPDVTGAHDDVVLECLDDLALTAPTVVADRATFDGRNALVLVERGEDAVQGTTVVVVPPSCGRRPVTPLAGPFHLR